MFSKTQNAAQGSSVTLRSRLHLNVRNVPQRLVSQHSMAYLHDKEGNDNMTEKKN